jgi:uncharacterized protein
MSDWRTLLPLIVWPSLTGLALGLLLRAIWEPTRLDCRVVRIKPAAHDPGSAVQPLRVLFFSDLHAEHFRLDPDRLLAACAGSRPDVILFGGDLAGKPERLPQALNLMDQVRRLPELAGIPFLAVRGNHDTDESVRGLSQLGIQVLENTGRILVVRQESWLVAGLQSRRTGRPDFAQATLPAEAAGIPPSRRLFVAHNPDGLLDLPPNSAACFLAGHFHGGQIWLPFRLEFFLLRRERLPRIGHYRGQFYWRDTPAFISRGLGCVSLPLRLFSLPELAILEIG